MDFYGAFSQLWREKKFNIYFGSIFISYEVNYGFCKGNTQFSELNNFYCIQELIWSEKLSLLGLLKKYEK